MYHKPKREIYIRIYICLVTYQLHWFCSRLSFRSFPSNNTKCQAVLDSVSTWEAVALWEAVLRSDEVQSPVAFVDLAVRSFLRNKRRYWLGSLRKTPHGGYFPYRPRPHKRTIGLKPTTQPKFCRYSMKFFLIYRVIQKSNVRTCYNFLATVIMEKA